ncbi:DUF362 domain-containing protein [Geoalkalibacter sp.]|uniref:DUF362 domain-containing protein n=1 Tax=Geoalkalibacter sp. TaxID=3041440 RepID=UPI00272DEAC1|nr:4Fe-4S binding protein [Geoalkalibacter sp.]
MSYWSFYHITDDCTACGACEIICPIDAIVWNRNRTVYAIDNDLCSGCGACETICPYAAIEPT